MKKIISFYLIFISVSTAFSQNYLIDTLLPGLNQPADFAFIPNSSKVIITHKSSSAKIYDINNNTLISTFWDFTDSLVSANETGVLGVCLDPNYTSNHYVYIYYTHCFPLNSNTLKARIVRFTENNNIGTNPVIIFEVQQANFSSFHWGGIIRIKPSDPGKIYLVLGARTFADCQTLTNPRGKVLRVNTNGTIPTDNPFYDDGNPATGNDDRIWTYGLRNSFGFCFGPNDSMYETENGEMNYDECNIIIKGKNYGGGICEGYCNPYNPAYKNPMVQLGIPQPTFMLPALTGILIYSGSQMPWLNGKLIAASNNTNSQSVLYQCDFNAAKDSIVNHSVLLNLKGLTAIFEGTDGYIYAMNGGYTTTGKIYRIKPDPAGIISNGEPVQFILSQNYPNPFNPTTNIKFEIARGGFTTLKVYDAVGSEVTTLLNENKTRGEYEINFDASNYPSGVYFYKLTVGEQSIQKKMVLIK